MTRRAFGRSFSAIFGPRTRASRDKLDAFWALIRHNDGQRVMHRLIRDMQERRRHRERWVGALRQARIPLRVIDGPEDPVSGARMFERYRELVPAPDTVLLEGIGHFPQVEDPAGVLRAVLDFHHSRVGRT